MNTKLLVFIGMTLGSIIGGYLPVLFGVDIFSFTSILTSAIGACLGIWLGFKLSQF